MADQESKSAVSSRDGSTFRPKVFVSYSRKDTAFSEALVAELTQNGFQAYLDTKAIAPGEPWQERIAALIVKADAIVFVLSPDSIDPKSVCDWELNESERLSKRIIPVVCRHVTEMNVPGRLKRLNYVFLTPERNRADEFAKLVDGLKVDIRWVRQHTDIGEAAERWSHPEKGGEHDLLQGKAINDAELWISSRPAEAPELTDVQRAFIKASREAEIARAEKERRQIKRTRWFQRVVGVLLVIGLTGVIWQDIETTEREQTVFTSKAADAYADERNELRMRYALQGLPAKGAWPWTPQSSALAKHLEVAPFEIRLVQTLRGHKGPIHEAVFNNDGTRVLTASEDYTARIWNAVSGKHIITLSGHKGSVCCASFSPDGKRVVTASEDGTARLWNAETGAVIATLDDGDATVTRASFSLDGKWLATASSNTARVWDGQTGSAIAKLKAHNDFVVGVNFSPDGKRLLTSSTDKTARVWDVETATEIAILRGHEQPLNGASFNFDGRFAVSASDDGTARLWDTATGSELAVFRGHENSIVKASFSPDGKLLLTASLDQTARLWDIEKASLVRILGGHTGEVWEASFSSFGDFVITVSDDGAARLWHGGDKVTLLKGHESVVRSASFTRDQRRVVTASFDHTARIWDTHQDYAIAIAQDGEISREGPKRLEKASENWANYNSIERSVQICAELLVAKHEELFSLTEIKDPILAGISADDLVARNPCLRRGPLNWEY